MTDDDDNRGAARSAHASWNQLVIDEFLAGRDRIADRFDREVLLLLETVGARSGQPRTTPLAHLADGDRLVVVASAAGSDKHPAWYHNLVAEPRVRVRRWRGEALEEFAAVATPAGEPERSELFAAVVARMPGFADYQANTERVIPVVVLTPAAAPRHAAGTPST